DSRPPDALLSDHASARPAPQPCLASSVQTSNVTPPEPARKDLHATHSLAHPSRKQKNLTTKTRSHEDPPRSCLCESLCLRVFVVRSFGRCYGRMERKNRPISSTFSQSVCSRPQANTMTPLAGGRVPWSSICRTWQ